MNRDLICIGCPLGCMINVEYEGNQVLAVKGNTCKRGDQYARTEIVNPTRSIASTVKVVGGVHPVVPVKTDKPIPKTMIFDCMKEINKAVATAPVQIGDVIIENILGTGANVVATNID